MAESTRIERPRVATLWLDDIQDWGLAGYDPRRGMWVPIEGRAVGDLGPDRVGALAEASWDGQPPAGLSGVLSSVDDVARVCEAAGLGGFTRLLGGINVVRWGVGETELVALTADDEVLVWHAAVACRPVVIPLGQRSAVLWSAIQAARGGEHQ